MNRLPAIGRLAVIVAGLAGALLALCAGPASAAFATVLAPLGGDPHGRPGLPAGHPGPATSPPPAHDHTPVTSGMPGWQITLLVAGGVLLAAALLHNPDLLVLDDTGGDPYERLISARETAISLVVINGVPRYGAAALMARFGAVTEDVTVGGSRRSLKVKRR